jgi:arylsulfatase A-like enzyme
MELSVRRLRPFVLIGVGQGALAWVAYAIVECWFVTIIPLIFQTFSGSMLNHLGFTAILFCVYVLIGTIIGGIIGLVAWFLVERIPTLVRVEIHSILSLLATSSILVAYFINLVIRFRMRPSIAALSVLSLVLLVVVLMNMLRWPAWNEKFGFLTKPVIVTSMILGASWILLDLFGENTSRLLKAGTGVLYLVCCVLVSLLFKKHLKLRHWPRSVRCLTTKSGWRLAFLAAAVFFTLGLSAWINRTPAPIIVGVGSSPPQVDLPNIIFIVMDSVRADHLSLYGYERDTCPNLRSFAEEATLFRRAYATSDQTLPSHASMFTGLYASRHGAHFDPPDFPLGRPLSNDVETLAEVLSAKGYLTMAVVANWGHLSPAFNLSQGFQYYDCRRGAPFLKASSGYYLRTLIYEIFKSLAPRSAFDLICQRAADINQQVYRFIDRGTNSHRPFFLFINYMDAHLPYLPPPPFDMLYPGKNDSFTTHDYWREFNDVIQLKRGLSENEYQNLVSQYDGAIAYLDFEIQQVLERIKKSHVYQNSLIIITSDHGEAFGEKNLMYHGLAAYQDLIYVPLIIKYPGPAKRKESNQLVSCVDFMPTILDVLGFKPPETIQGQSLLATENESGRVVFAESYPSSDVLRLHPRFHRIQSAMFSGTMKIIKSTDGTLELYNLADDPNEDVNIFEPNGQSHQLEEKLENWLKTVRGVSGPSPKLDRGTVEKLRSLGYVGEDTTANRRKK